MTHSFKGKKLLPLLIFLLCFAIILTSAASLNAFAASPDPIGKTNTIKVAQISDVHYFPRDLCPWDYDSTNQYAIENKQDFKLVAESGTMLNAACDKILAEAKNNGLDVLIVSGDLTKDGEKRSHIDLANRLRKLQEDIRIATANKDFQIFVIPGNHDTYNSDGNTYNIITDVETGEVKDYVLDKYNNIVYAEDSGVNEGQKRYLLNYNKVTNKKINYLKDNCGRPVIDKEGSKTFYLDVNGNRLNIADISEIYTTSKLRYNNKPIATTSNQELVKIYSGLGFPDFSDAEILKFKSSPMTAYTSNNYGEYNFNTPFMNFVPSKNASCYDFTYFFERKLDKDNNIIQKGNLDYAAQYVIDFLGLDTPSNATLSQKEAYINKNSIGKEMYKNVSLLGYCSYIAVPNIEKFAGYTFAMLDSNLREVSLNGYQGYEHSTGGILADTVFDWLKDNLKADSNTTLADRQETIISSLHHGTIPHFMAHESFMTDFLLYNWEDQIVRLTNLGIQFTLTGHVHASDVATYVANNGKEITDIVTGSIISYGAPIRFMNFARQYNDATGKIENTITDKVQSITSFENVASDFYNNPTPGTETTILDDTSPKIDFFKKPGNINKVQEYLYDTTMDKVIPHILEGYVNASLFEGLKTNLPTSDFGILIEELLDKAASINVKYLDGTEMSLFEFIYNSVYDVIGNEGEEKDFDKYKQIEDVKIDNKYDSTPTSFSVHDLLRYSYTRYIINGEIKSLDDIDKKMADPSIPDSDKLTLKFMYSMNKYIENGELAKMILGDPSKYNEKHFGLLYPLLYAENNLVDQVLDYTFDFSTTEISDRAMRILNVLFQLLGYDFESTSTFTLNQLVAAVAKDAASFNDQPGLVGIIISDLNRGKLLSTVLRDLINSYASNNFYINLSGVLSDVLQSFGVQNKIGYTLNVDNSNDATKHFIADGIVDDGQIYKTNPANIIPENDYQIRGIAPSMLTLNYGKDAKTTMNLMWNTAPFRESHLHVYDKDNNELDSVEVFTNDVVYGYPKFDIGLFANNSNETVKDYVAEIEKNGWAKTTKQKRVYKAFIKGLEPGSTYTYKIITVSDSTCDGKYPNLANNTLTVNGTFTTAPASGKFTFLAVSDIQGTHQHSYTEAKRNIQNAITSISGEEGAVDFIVNAGDIVDNGNNIKQWYYALNNENYNPSTGTHTVFSKYPTLIAAGNHEASNRSLIKYFNMENADYIFDVKNPTDKQIADGKEKINKAMDTGVYYSYKIANAKFIVLNTNTATVNGLDEMQYKWLVQELADEDGIDWKFVVMHKGIYSSSNHINDVEVKALREQLNSLFYDNDVDVVLQGHDHTFTTSKFLDRNGNEVDNSNVEKENGNKFDRPAGVMYITLGTIADKYYPYVENNNYTIDESRSILSKLDKPTYCYFTINDKSLKINWRSLNPEANNRLASNTMTIDKTRSLHNDAGFQSITINTPKPVVIKSGTTTNTVVEVPYGFNLADITIQKGNNVWEKWTIEKEVEVGGKITYQPISSTAILRRTPLNARIVIKSEDGTKTTYVPITFNVKNAIETKLGDLLKINGLNFTEGLKFSNLTDPLSMDIITKTGTGVTITSKDINERHNTATYFFTYHDEDFVLYQKGYKLNPKGVNYCQFILTDSEGNNLMYDVQVENPAPKDPTKTALIAIIGVLAGIIIINLIVKLIRHGKGIFSVFDKYRDKNKDDYYIQ